MPTRNTNGSGGTLTPVHPGSRCATGSDKQRGLRPGVRLAACTTIQYCLKRSNTRTRSACRFRPVSRHSLSETPPYFADPSKTTQHINSPYQILSICSFCLVTSSAHPFRRYSPITAVYSSRLTGSLRMLLSTACNLCSANGRLSGNRISPGSTIALLSTANRRMLACDETDHLPNPESFFFLGAGCRWIRAPRTSSTTVPCCLQFKRSDTGIERLTLDSPDQKQLSSVLQSALCCSMLRP
ncbi:hypothetical protein T03_6707 [Trichinella britovi]|uniref:Uncharacterized protein n=1 Tax=Trichinella britovi TaxID=45882 RepID=A0A0V1DB35_TRIBR|nr:hypothetical protein T03_6707 [Trichinella britovi]